MKKEPLMGVFDSGVGGFSVYKKIRGVSTANCIYYGDCARAPYGNREDEELFEFTKDNIAFLQEEGVTHFINACNSMSVVTTNLLLKECGIDEENYIDMIRAFRKHASFSVGEKVLVMATSATLRSGAYQEALRVFNVEVYEYPFKHLALAIENTFPQKEILNMVEEGLLYAKEKGVTKIIYGCTHYPLVHDIFLLAKDAVGWEGEFIDPAVCVAEEVKRWNVKGESRFTPYSSKDTPAFIKSVISLL